MKKKLGMIALLALLAACGTTPQEGGGGRASNQATAVEAVEISELPANNGSDDVADEVADENKGDLGIDDPVLPDFSHFMEIVTSPVAEWDCSGSSVAGDASDADDDGIAKNATYTILCTKSFGFAGVSPFEAKREGTLTMQDADDHDPTSGYRSQGSITYSYTVMGQTYSATRAFDRHWTGNASSGYGFDHTHSWTWSAAGHEYKVEHARSGRYTPDDADDPFAAGDLSEEGTIEHTVNGGDLVTIAEAANLHLKRGCTPPADRGTIRFTVNGTTKTYEFNGCGQYHEASGQAGAVQALEVVEDGDQASGEDAVEDAAEAADTPFALLPDLGGIEEILAAPAAAWDCSASSTSGDTTDADADGIAKDASYTIDCVKDVELPAPYGTVRVSRTGTVTVQDADDGDPTSGYDASGDLTYGYDFAGQSYSATRTFARHWSGTAAEGYAFSHEQAWTWSAVGQSYRVESEREGSYDPDGWTDPFAAGLLNERGTVKLYVDSALQASVSETTDDLHVNQSCDPAADAGSVSYSWDDRSVTVNFTGCGEYEVQ